jgi:ubiquinone/menaquinone biosynthesis C-methylase UbiE
MEGCGSGEELLGGSILGAVQSAVNERPPPARVTAIAIRTLKLVTSVAPRRDKMLSLSARSSALGATGGLMGEATKSVMRSDFRHYDADYKQFGSELYAEIRREAFGEDMGQTSWITADEQDRTLPMLNLAAGKILLDVACGSGGPALRIAERTGCSIVGVDIHEDAVATANSQAAQRGMRERAAFQVEDATEHMSFADEHFDAIICIDAINHLGDRPHVISEFARLLKPGGRMLITDPTTVTGPLTGDELRIRSSIGTFLFVPVGYDQRVIQKCGLRLLLSEDVTENMAKIAHNRGAARAARADDLRRVEGEEIFEKQQRFFEVAARIARERRLSRFLYVAEKPI